MIISLNSVSIFFATGFEDEEELELEGDEPKEFKTEGNEAEVELEGDELELEKGDEFELKEFEAEGNKLKELELKGDELEEVEELDEDELEELELELEGDKKDTSSSLCFSSFSFGCTASCFESFCGVAS